MSKRTASQTNGQKPSIFKPSKTACPITLAQFLANANPSMPITIDGVPFSGQIDPREFSTGSFGFNLNGKCEILVGGVPVKFQVSANLTACGSKDAPRS